MIQATELRRGMQVRRFQRDEFRMVADVTLLVRGGATVDFTDGTSVTVDAEAEWELAPGAIPGTKLIGELVEHGMPPVLARDIAQILEAHPALAQHGALANECGAVVLAAARLLGARGWAVGLLSALGYPAVIDGSPAAVANPDLAETGSGHFLLTVDTRQPDIGTLVLDLAYRQFDPGAPAVVWYPREILESTFGPWLPWDEVQDEIAPGEAIEASFVEYHHDPEHLARRCAPA